MANLAEFLVEMAERQPLHAALRMGPATIDYAELDQRSARAAALLLAEGIRPGDRVALKLPNVPEFVVLYYGILRAGGVVVPMNPLLKPRETAHHLEDSGATLLFEWHATHGEGVLGATKANVRHVVVEPDSFATRLAGHQPQPGVAPTENGDIAVLLYTSGTTGGPKGAALTHGALRHNTEVAVAHIEQLTAHDAVVGCLPLFHIFGQTCAMNAAVHAGATLILLPRFDPQTVLDTITEHGATVFEGVPTMYVALLQHAGTPDLSTLRLCISGGASLPVEVLHGFERRFGCTVLEGYGLSEATPVSFNHHDRPRKPGSIGTPVADAEVRLLSEHGHDVPAGEVGELAVRGPGLMKEYWNRPQETAAAIPDGWMRTGDLAREDEDGYLYIVDRKKDLIIRAGYNVYPREIEEVLHEHPAVAMAAVIGIPDERLGEEVAAAVVLRPQDDSTTPQELREFTRERLAAYKYPRIIWLTDALPLGPSGKILKREIIVPTAAPDTHRLWRA